MMIANSDRTDNSDEPVLEFVNVSKHYKVSRGIPLLPKRTLHAVDDVDFAIRVGETVGVIGESGCGKSTFGRVLAGLEQPTTGSLFYNGVDVSEMDRAQKRDMRRNVQMIFQDPASSLNPRQTIQQIIEEPYEIHPDLVPAEGKRAAALRMLEKVGLKPEHARRRPHELSGGQQQRVGIARALVLQPRVLVCDEAVSALDVSVRAQIVNLLRDLQDEFGLAYLFIAHDLQVVRNISDRVIVMYLGKIVESGEVEEIYSNTAHPYTQALLAAAPELRYAGEQRRARSVEGDPPTPIEPGSECRFRSRCSFATEICGSTPDLEEFAPDHRTACFHAAEVRADLSITPSPAT